jgi:hypothetical protein
MFTPRLNILPPQQRRLWDELSATPKEFALYGGTALALRLGHRTSVDFDFFAPNNFDPAHLRNSIKYLEGGRTLQEEANTLTMLLDRNGPIQISYFGLPRLGQIEEHDRLQAPAISIASLIDIAGFKTAVVARRAEPKDYADIHALLTQTLVTLPEMLGAAIAIYGPSFNPLVSLKAIAHFNEPALIDLPTSLKTSLTKAVKSVALDQIPTLNVKRVAKS